MSYQTVVLKGRYVTPDGSPAKGRVEIECSTPTIKDMDGDTIVAGKMSIRLDENGEFSIELPASDDPTLTPTGFGWILTPRVVRASLRPISFLLNVAESEVINGENVRYLSDVAAVSFTPANPNLETVGGSQAKADAALAAAIAYTQEQLDNLTLEDGGETVTGAQAKADAALAAAKTYTDGKATNTLNTAKSYADGLHDTAMAAAAAAETDANAYTDAALAGFEGGGVGDVTQFELESGLTETLDLANTYTDEAIANLGGGGNTSLNQLEDVNLTSYVEDEEGNVLSEGPRPGLDFLGVKEDGSWSNLEVSPESLGLYGLFAPKDPNGQFLLYGTIVPEGQPRPTSGIPHKSLIIDGNRPDRGVFDDVFTSDVTGGIVLPRPVLYQVHDLTLLNDCSVTLPPAQPGALIEVNLRQGGTGGNEVTWSSNVKFTKDGAPVLEAGVGAEDTLIFRCINSTWRIVGHYKFGGAPVAGPTPTFVSEIMANSGGATPTTISDTMPVVAPGDVAVMTAMSIGGTNSIDQAAIEAQGWTYLAAVNNHDVSPTIKATLFKRKLNGTEDNQAITVTTLENEHQFLQGAVYRGVDYDRISFVPARDTTVDTVLDVPAITPAVDNSRLVHFSHQRHNRVAGTRHGTNRTDTSWTVRVDNYEGLPADGTTLAYSTFVADKGLSGGAQTEHPATTQAFYITASDCGWVLALPPVSV